MTDPFEDEFMDTLPQPRTRGGILGLSLGVILGTVVAAAIVGALLLIRLILLPPGSLN